MRLSDAQLRCLKFLKDHSHPHNHPGFHHGTLVANTDPNTLWPQARRASERTVLSLERAGLVEFVRYEWQQGRDGKTSLSAQVRLTGKGLGAWLAACDRQPALRSL